MANKAPVIDGPKDWGGLNNAAGWGYGHARRRAEPAFYAFPRRGSRRARVQDAHYDSQLQDVGAYPGLTSRRWQSGGSSEDGNARHPLYEAAYPNGDRFVYLAVAVIRLPAAALVALGQRDPIADRSVPTGHSCQFLRPAPDPNQLHNLRAKAHRAGVSSTSGTLKAQTVGCPRNRVNL
jgi:hypothetical protein